MNPRKLKTKTVQQLANQAGLDLDDALVTLWEAGFEHVLSPSHIIRPHELEKAQKALHLVTGKEIDTLQYWEELLGCSRLELMSILSEFGLSINKETSKVPKGGVSKLKAEARIRGIDPLTGVIKQPEGHRQFQIKKIDVPLEWGIKGHGYRQLHYLTEEEVIKIHNELVRDFALTKDPISPSGVRDRNLLASAVFRPQTSLGNSLKYPTVEMSAAALLHSIIQNHSFHNGNKRTALVSMLVVMDKNGVMMLCDEDDIFRLLLLIAQHKIIALHSTEMADREVLAITDWLCSRSRLIDKSERPIPWRRLKSILQSYDCRIENAKSGGRKINILREFKEKNFFGLPRIRTLNTSVSFGEYDGRDVQTSTIKKIREDLQLNEENGIDSRMFYEKEPEQTADFIARYRKTLNRLAKF